ncbi:hypothetical protein FRB96_005977 [Tulasnella sp. 330]|nr:hypothetical protein FRB96_005977 [Tulasnella sp. 330]
MSDDAYNAVTLALGALAAVLGASPIPDPFKAVATAIPAIAVQVIRISQVVKTNKRDARDFALYIGRLTDTTLRPLQDLGRKPINAKMENAVADFHDERTQVALDMGKLTTRSRWRRTAGYGSDPMKIVASKERIRNAVEIIDLIERLGKGDNGAAVKGRDGKERICLEGTRKAALDVIEKWIEDSRHEGKHILWLKAAAGCGKSCVAATVEKRAKASKRLGAAFYFARGKATHNAGVIVELSRQLASRPELQSAIAAAVKEDRNIARRTPAYQYLKLIHDPLLTLGQTTRKLVIIVDAVDECDQQDASDLLEFISRDHERLPAGVKFVITSRIDPHIRCELESPSVSPTVEHLSLDGDSSGVERDIAAYFKERLPALTKRLFIWAATSALLLADPNFRDPEAQLERLLSTPSLTNLDDLYLSALDHAFPPTVAAPVLALLRNVLGALVAARTPINVMTLAALLASRESSPDETAGEIHNKILSWLQAILTIPDGDDKADADPIQFLHQSFVDFLIREDRCDNRFLLRVPEHHEQMAIRCLRCMSNLQRNICHLTDPSKLNSEVEGLSAKIEEYISPALAYACLYWTDHLSEARTDSKESLEVDLLVEHFLKQKILYWIEVLSLLGKTKEAVILLRSADTWVTARASLVTLDPSLSVLLRDARRFLLEFMEPISTSSLHIYSSALAFSPSSTELVASYGHMLDAGPKPLRGRSVKWSNTLWVGSKHSNAVTCLEWSPSGKILASGSHDTTVRLWDKETGTVVGGGPLGGHTCGVLCLAWSPGGKVLASGSADTNLRLWEADTGATFGIPLVGHTDKVSCIAWSPNGKVLASGSSGKTISGMWRTMLPMAGR